MAASADDLANWGYIVYTSRGEAGLQDVIDLARLDEAGDPTFDRAELEAAAAAFEAVQERDHVSRIKGRVLRGILAVMRPPA